MNNTVTQQQIDDLFNKSEKTVEPYFDTCTVMTIQLPNGFVLVESTACVDRNNFSEEIGIEICTRKIKDKIWELEGYRLQCELDS